jgi:hypothetical protein
MEIEMTTPLEKKILQPESWTLNCLTDDSKLIKEHGFATLNSALKRLRSIQLLCYPSTIQQVELNQVLELDEIDQASQDELAYLDERFLQAMEDSRK